MGFFEEAEDFFDDESEDSDWADDFDTDTADTLHFVSAALDFVSHFIPGIAGFSLNLIADGVEYLADQIDIQAIGSDAFDEAMGMAGNAGQETILEEMEDAFYNAAEAATSPYSENQVLGILLASCSHPEAVGEILTSVADFIRSEASNSIEELMD